MIDTQSWIPPIHEMCAGNAFSSPNYTYKIKWCGHKWIILNQKATNNEFHHNFWKKISQDTGEDYAEKGSIFSHLLSFFTRACPITKLEADAWTVQWWLLLQICLCYGMHKNNVPSLKLKEKERVRERMFPVPVSWSYESWRIKAWPCRKS